MLRLFPHTIYNDAFSSPFFGDIALLVWPLQISASRDTVKWGRVKNCLLYKLSRLKEARVELSFEGEGVHAMKTVITRRVTILVKKIGQMIY